MKKSTLLLILGIVLIALAFCVDAYISQNVLDFSQPELLRLPHYLCLAGFVLAIAAGIVLIVVSRKIAKKEK